MEEKNTLEFEHHDHEHDHEEHEHHHEHEGHEHHHHHHEHEHDHEGHEHHHHHDHEHDHEGHEHHHHDHGHEGHEHHHHDHEHEGHEHHHHDHGHQYDVPGFRVFETHNHEGATICSFEKDVKTADAADLAARMESSICLLEKWLDETEAVIGHVKGYIREAGPITTFSTVGLGLNVEKHESDSVSVGFASIVFGPTEEELKNKVEEIFCTLG